MEQKQQIKSILCKIEEQSKQITEANLNIMDMFKPCHVIKTLIMMLNWITVNVGSYTLLLNTTKLHGDIFINFILST